MNLSMINVPIYNLPIYASYFASIVLLCFVIQMGLKLVSIKKETGKMNWDIIKKIVVLFVVILFLLALTQMMELL